MHMNIENAVFLKDAQKLQKYLQKIDAFWNWQNVSSAGSSIGHKAAVYAGKALCGTAIDLIESPEILQKARDEFGKRTASGYVCPIPPDAIAEI